MRVDLSVRCLDRSERELRALHDWLLLDAAARRWARPSLHASRSAPPGAQGDVVDLLSLVIGSGFNAASLALSVMAWRGTRPQPPTITFQRPDGQSVTISGSSPDEARRIIELLADGAENGDDDSSA